MTIKKISKGLANSRLSPSYRFKRLLRTTPEIAAVYRDRDERINRVQPIKDILVVDVTRNHITAAPFLDTDSSFPSESTTHETIPITRHQSEWPFRVEYIEQLLALHGIWIVVADTVNQNPIDSLTREITYDIGIDVIHIPQPVVKVEQRSLLNYTGEPLITESQLLELERDPGPAALIFPHAASIYSRENQDTFIDIYHCNILPQRLSFYNATFYNRDVAHLYVDSLAEHLKRYNR